jgi:hypothetical protein
MSETPWDFFSDEAPAGGDPAWEGFPPDVPADLPPPPDFGIPSFDGSDFDPASLDAPPPPASSLPAGKRGKDEPHPLEKRVRTVIREVLGRLDGESFDETYKLVTTMSKADKVLACLGKDARATVDGVFELLLHEAQVTSSGFLDLEHLPSSVLASDEVRLEAKHVAEQAREDAGDTYAVWQALVEEVQRHQAKSSALAMVTAIEARQPASSLMDLFGAIEAPTAQRGMVEVTPTLTARERMLERQAVMAGRQPMRFSCGMPSLDIGLTAKGQARGFIGPGEFLVIMGPTGTGKSSFSYGVTPAMLKDMCNWGLPDAIHVLAHTEEADHEKIDAIRVGPGATYAHLGDMLVVDEVGSSRRRMVQTLYNLTARAEDRARESKRPITDFLVHQYQLDYIQAIEEQGESETEASTRTANLILRGICAWNPEEMAKYSGLSYREHTGREWPKGMEHHKVAVIAYAQLTKVNETSQFYKAAGGKMPVSDFAKIDPSGNPYWEVKENDLRLFSKSNMRGSGVIANNAHAMLILHRSRPVDNYEDPSKLEEVGGYKVSHLSDTRARILFEKARSGASSPYADLQFDLQVDGPKAQYFDRRAEEAIQRGKIRNYDRDMYSGPGAPIIPLRPYADPFSACRY